MPVDADRVRSAEVGLAGPTAWPRRDDGPVFVEPWEGRAFGLALDVVDGLGLGWDAFREQLVAAIAADPDRPYYESWLVALEALVDAETSIDAADVHRHRAEAASYRYDEEGVGDIEVFPIAPDERTLESILTRITTTWWAEIQFGPIIQGAVYELRFDRRPELSLLDGYLTIDGGSGHVHLCIGEHTGRPGRGVTPHVARRRRCQHAELYRVWLDGAPTSWGFRMFNGDDEQQLTILLPNPFLDERQAPLPEPDWDRLRCWDSLRAEYLDLGPDARDRTGTHFRHG